GGGNPSEPHGGLFSEALAKEVAACAAPLASDIFQLAEARCAVLAARDLTTPPLAGDAEHSFIYLLTPPFSWSNLFPCW
ncbi:MAG: hypothetical protein WBL24_00940, partial [Kiritimatiellia bacterium]